MKRFFLLIASTLLILTACNTLYNNRMVQLEVFQPAKVIFPSDINKIVLRYNNVNIPYNPDFSKYFFHKTYKVDETNLDSTASLVFFDAFKKNLQESNFFDTIFVLKKQDYSNYRYKKRMFENQLNDSLSSEGTSISKFLPVDALRSFLNTFAQNDTTKKEIPFDSEFGLYTQQDIQNIHDSTGADLLISLDFYASTDGKSLDIYYDTGHQSVLSMAFWSLYYLKKQEYFQHFEWLDTVRWEKSRVYTSNDLKKLLPPREEAVLAGAEISGANFTHFLTPHWLEVERIYYRSGHIDLKQTENLVKEGKWMEAAVIWKKHIDNPNKKIAAKSMYNLALACEVEGELDAAMDWVVKSYLLLGNKNQVHAFHCMDYISILGLRKIDFKKLDVQLNNLNAQDQ